METGRVAVVGGGIIGLSTALEIKRKVPEIKVVIFSESVSPHTTADGAAGILGLYLMGDTPLEKQVRWAKVTHDMIENLWKTPLGGKLGISLISCTRLNHSPVPPPWKDVVYGIREITSKEVQNFGRLDGTHKSGLEFTTFTVEPARFLPFLMQQFTVMGGEIVRRKVESLSDLLGFDVIVNCAGCGARNLVGDKELHPLRGQVMRISAPWIRSVVLDDREDGNYVIPNQDCVVLGGTHQVDDWDQTPRQEDKDFIFSGSCALEPSLVGGNHSKDWVGLRPGRASVRLEREVVGGLNIVHNYGHGGSGITTFQGCAEDACLLVLDAMSGRKLGLRNSKL